MHKDDKYIGSAGVEITAIVDANGEPIPRLSDVKENWEIQAKCPDCHRVHIRTEEDVDKPIHCPCGRTLYTFIPEHLR